MWNIVDVPSSCRDLLAPALPGLGAWGTLWSMTAAILRAREVRHRSQRSSLQLLDLCKAKGRRNIAPQFPIGF